MAVVPVNDIEMAYEIEGVGPRLVLISGVGYGGWFWKPLVAQLKDHFSVLTFDNRGAGGTTHATGPYTVQQMASDTAGLMDALNFSPAVICGHSLGGFIAQELAVARPDLVEKLILAGTNHGGTDVIPITQEALAVMMNRDGDPVELVRNGIEIASAAGFADRQPEIVQALTAYRFTGPVPGPQYQAQVMAGAGMGLLTAEQVVRRMAALTMPVLILFGEEDRVVPPGNAEYMARKIPNAEIEIIKNTGHIFPIEDPQAAAETIIKFAG